MEDKILRIFTQLTLLAVGVYVISAALGKKETAVILDTIRRNTPGMGGKWTMGKGATPPPPEIPNPSDTVVL